MSLNNEHKERLVNMFLRGQSVTDLSAFYAVQRRSVEDVLREAIYGLARLNQSLAAPNPSELEPTSNNGHSDAETPVSEPVVTSIEAKSHE